MASTKNLKRLFFVLFVAGLVWRTYIAYRFQTRAWIDEIWAVLNPGYKLFIGRGATIDDPIESGLRSWVPPLLLWAYLKLLSVFGVVRGVQVLPAVRIAITLFTALGLLTYSCLLRAKLNLRYWPILPLTVLFFNPEFVHYAATADLSVLGTPFLLIGLALVLMNDEKKPTLNSRLGGFLLVFSALVRFQYGVYVLCLLFALAKRREWRKFLELSAIGIGLLVFDFALNSLMYQKPILPVFNYFVANVGGLAANYGVTPFYFAFELLFRFTLMTTFFIVILTLPSAYRRLRYLTVTTVLFFAIHSFVGHKEYRFFYGPAVLFAGQAAAVFQKWIEGFPKYRGILAVSFLLVFATEATWRGLKKTGWRDFQIPSQLETLAGDQPDVKGLITYGWNGVFTGGHYTFHKNLPYVFLPERSWLRTSKLDPRQQYNYLVTGDSERIQGKPPCEKSVQSQEGATLYRCTVQEMERLITSSEGL